MRKLCWLLPLLALLLWAVPASAVVCGNSVTWLNNSPTTSNFGANLVSSLNYACLVIVDPTTSTQALGIDSSGRIGVNPGTASQWGVQTQGSTTSGQSGSPAMGAAVTAPPSLTNGQSNFLSLDLNAGLRTAPTCNKVKNVTQTATTDQITFTGFGYICSIVLISATAQNIGVDEGTGTTCETSGTALIGVSSTSAATATMAVPANGGIVVTSGVPWLRTQTTGDHLCVVQSSSGNVSGTITYADLSN